MEGVEVTEHEKCTAVLLNYARHYHIGEIVQTLANVEQIDEVIVWNNGPAGILVDEIPETRLSLTIVDSRENICTFGRYRAAMMARNDLIFTQDDDVLVLNAGQLLERFGSHRRSITAGLTANHFRIEANRTPWLQIGWGGVFLREWLACLDRWIESYGEDAVLHRKFDRIFTALHGKHDPVLQVEPRDVVRLRDRNGRESGRDANALWLRRDHGQLTTQAMHRVLELKERA